MLGRRGLLVLSLLGAITLVVQAQVPDLPRPGLFQIVSLKLSGAGCPNAFTGLPSDPAMTMSLEGLSFPLSNMSTQIPGPIQLRTKSCQAHFSIRIREPGWQWAVTTVELKGYLVLEAGANLDVFVSAFWSERPTQMVTKQESVQNTGGLPLTVFEHFTVDSTLWSPCSGQDGLSGILNLNLRVAFGTTNKTNGMPAFGYFGPYAIVDSGFEYPVTEKLTFSLRQCSPGQENANATVP